MQTWHMEYQYGELYIRTNIPLFDNASTTVDSDKRAVIVHQISHTKHCTALQQFRLLSVQCAEIV